MVPDAYADIPSLLSENWTSFSPFPGNERLKRFIGHQKITWILRALVGAVFIVSAIAKLWSIGQFEVILIQQNIFSDRFIAAYSARGLVAVELIIGLCYFQPNLLRTFFIPFSFFLTSAFTCYLAYIAVYTDYTENCGCFGDLIQMSPIESIIKNIIILAVIMCLFRLTRSDPVRRSWIPPAAIGMVTVLAIAMLYPVKIVGVSDIVVSSKQKVSGKAAFADATPTDSRFAIFNSQAGQGAKPNIVEGDWLVAFFSLDCDHCKDVAMEMGIWRRGRAVNIFSVFLGEGNQVKDFYRETDTKFPYVIASPIDFFNFIGNAPPRVYSLREGKILAFWELDNFSTAAIDAHLTEISPVP